MSTDNLRVSGIFVNLPVQDLQRSIAYFRELGFAFDPRFTDATAACMVIAAPALHVMLLTRERFKGFAPHPVADASASTGVLLALALDSRAAVDRLVQRAVAGGGRTFRAPEDHGFMYGHAFQDLDGHVWEPFHMDPDALEQMGEVSP
jgi:uncharacterized protein